MVFELKFLNEKWMLIKLNSQIHGYSYHELVLNLKPLKTSPLKNLKKNSQKRLNVGGGWRNINTIPPIYHQTINTILTKTNDKNDLKNKMSAMSLNWDALFMYYSVSVSGREGRSSCHCRLCIRSIRVFHGASRHWLGIPSTNAQSHAYGQNTHPPFGRVPNVGQKHPKCGQHDMVDIF